MTIRFMTSLRWVAAALVLVAPLAMIGCFNTTPDYSGLAQGPAPLRIPSPERTAAASESYEDSLTGGQIFSMYCAQCHNPRPLAERPFSTAETAHFLTPAASWSMFVGVVRPHSRGHLRITGPNPPDAIEIVDNTFSDAADMKAMIRAIELCREIGNSAGMSPFVKREVMPGNLTGGALESFVRDATSTFWHYACTAKMGRDEMSVVDRRLKVYGIDNLRVADASIMPRVTTGNTMATCVIIGERAAELIRHTYRI